jgi:uncharacterized protein YndB with AHSA1/START domain
MARIVDTVEIERSPEEVFAYLDQLTRHGEWQTEVVSARTLTDGPTRVGTRAVETRKFAGREQEMSYEVTEHDSPRVFAFRGLDGPLRPVGRATVEPLDGGARSRFTFEFGFETASFVGRLLLPIANSHARKQIPQDHRRLKERLESGDV